METNDGPGLAGGGGGGGLRGRGELSERSGGGREEKKWLNE